MTVQEIVVAIPKLTFDERITLLNLLTHSIRRIDIQAKLQGVPSSELRGVLKTDSLTPNDEEIKEAYTEYLMEKYK
jgi:hypothetical protein